ncbi:Rpp4 candidate [Arachis hypogaea]|nr:Rpp4 candidate [Arachis hypogaea]
MDATTFKECDRLVEIVTKDEAIVEGAPKEFALQSMTSIKLWSLPELECFYPSPHKLECPKLEEVHLFHCEKLKTFEFESQKFQYPQAECQAILLPEKVFPYLKFLALNKKEIMMMLHGQFHVNGLSKLEALLLQCFHDDSATFPYELLQKLPTIIQKLVLSTLSQLNSIGLEHSWMQQISENLEKLQIDKCHCLRSIVPSKVSFSSLIELNISECNGLVNLFTPSTSRTLHQMKNMSIKNCESLKEIVSEEEVGESSKLDEEKIIFKKLKTLSLRSLPNLERFYNGNIALKFPSLIKLLVIDCSKMESFCAGTVSVNRWMEVQFKEDYEYPYLVLPKQAFLLEDDLNCVVRNAFEGDED